MTFLAPARLLLLLLVAGLAAAYAVQQVRRTTYALRFTNVGLLDRLASGTPQWRRHVPAGLFLLMLTLLVTGFARPTAEVAVPRERATVLLVIDVSVSMQATDVDPSRIEAAREAAKDFVRRLPERFNVSLVTFCGNASQVAAPTADRAQVLQGLNSMALCPRTAIGEGVITALEGLRSFTASTSDVPRGGDELPPEPPPARLVLLSDGESNTGRTPLQAARVAAEMSVPISAIAYGTPTGTVTVDGESIPVPADIPTLRSMAEVSNGTFYEAASEEQLDEVYRDIGSSVGTRQERREISSWFIGAALAAAFAAAGTSLLWFARLP